MATNTATLAAERRARLARDIPQHVSPGLWTLAWRRLRRDRVGMVSLGIVVAFLLMMIASGVGLIARTGRARSASTTRRRRSPVRTSRRGRRRRPHPRHPLLPTAASDFQSTVVDPIGDVLADSR